MKAAEGKMGRVFLIRLEDGDEVPGSIERFAAEKQVSAGYALFVGGVGGGRVVVGPRESDARPPEPMERAIEDAHEVAAVGVLAPDEEGTPVLHIHGALGRSGSTVSGCFRKGVATWVTGEVILYEITGTAAVRVPDPAVGFSLLEPAGAPAKREEARPRSAAAAGKKAAPAAAVAAAHTGDRHSRVIYLLNAEVR